MKKILKKHWKHLWTGCILFVLLAVRCTFAGAETVSANATVSLADPETETAMAEYRKQLARQAAEIEKLRTENIQKQTENAQRTADLSRLASERSKQDAELKKRQAEIARLNAEIGKLQRSLADEKARNSAGMAKIRTENSDLELEKSMLEESNQKLRGELLDTLERCASLSDRVKRMEQSAAGVLETLNPVYAGQRETELADALDLAMQCGMKLVSRSTNVCEYLYPRLGKLGLGAVEEARFRVALDELAAMNRNFARLSVPAENPESLQNCRILEVSNDPEMVVINAGYRNGVRMNMTIRGGDGTKACVLRVIAVRPFVAAAVVTQGKLKDLSAGMELQMSEKKK